MKILLLSKYFIYSVFFVLVVFTSCKKNNVPYIACNQPSSDLGICKQLILGKWSFAYERYFNRVDRVFIIKTPSTEGFTSDMEFKQNGHAIFYKNSVLDKEVKYEITTLDVLTGYPLDNSTTILIFYELQSRQRIDYSPINICTDTLSLNYNAYSDTKGQQKWSKK